MGNPGWMEKMTATGEGRMDFSGKTVLITGSTRGIGLAAVRAFLDQGARVAVNGRRAEDVERVIGELGGDGLVAARGSIATVEGCEDVVGAALAGLGGLDVLVNNSAGYYYERTIEESDEAVWDESMDVNAKGMFFCTRAALPSLRERRGNIVNMGSEAGLIGFAQTVVYCASKGAVVNMTRAMALALAPEIRVNCLCPGAVDTEALQDGARDSGDVAAYMAALDGSYPMGRIASREEIADMILYLASDRAGFVTGATWQADGGSTAG